MLQWWVNNRSDVTGILTPDVDGLRKLYDISRKTYYPLQQETANEHCTVIGRFVFDNKGFELAQEILNGAMSHKGWVLVDEVGRLEMNHHRGLEPGLSTLIERVKNAPDAPNLLLVIRDYLLEEATTYYGLDGATVLPGFYFTPGFAAATNHLCGVVLCGGQSVRMGRDKALITYHELPQFRHLQQQLLLCCKQVCFSGNADLNNTLSQYGKAFVDSATFAGRGPLSGVLTAFEQHTDSALLVLGCDYPYLTMSDILALVMARDEQTDVVCYHNTASGYDEPLLAIYEARTAPLLLKFYEQGGESLRHFLSTVRVKRLHTDTQHLKSVDF